MEIVIGIFAIISGFYCLVLPIILFIFWLGLVHPSIVEFFSTLINDPDDFDDRKEIIPKYWLFAGGLILAWCSFLGLLYLLGNMNIQVGGNNIQFEIKHAYMISSVVLASAIAFSILAVVLDWVVDNFSVIAKRLGMALLVSIISGPLSAVVAGELGFNAETTGIVCSGITFVIVLFIPAD